MFACVCLDVEFDVANGHRRLGRCNACAGGCRRGLCGSAGSRGRGGGGGSAAGGHDGFEKDPHIGVDALGVFEQQIVVNLHSTAQHSTAHASPARSSRCAEQSRARE